MLLQAGRDGAKWHKGCASQAICICTPQASKGGERDRDEADDKADDNNSHNKMLQKYAKLLKDKKTLALTHTHTHTCIDKVFSRSCRKSRAMQRQKPVPRNGRNTGINNKEVAWRSEQTGLGRRIELEQHTCCRVDLFPARSQLLATQLGSSSWPCQKESCCPLPSLPWPCSWCLLCALIENSFTIYRVHIVDVDGQRFESQSDVELPYIHISHGCSQITKQGCK